MHGRKRKSAEPIQTPATTPACDSPASESPVATMDAPTPEHASEPATPGSQSSGSQAPEVVTPKRRPRKAQAEPVEEAIDPATIVGSVEAIVFSVERPVQSARIAEAIFHPKALPSPASSATPRDEDEDDEPKATRAQVAAVEQAIARLNAEFEETGRAFRIETVSGGWRVLTLPKHAEAVANFRRLKQSTKLSRAAVESLAIIAYKQPITRAQLEAIRGVACGEVLKSLIERRLVTIRGRAEELGRPMLYGTTKAFLDHFGLATLKDLPTPEELKPVL